jgi:hypothetical protein
MDAKLSGDRSQGQPLLPQVEGPSWVNVLLPRPAEPSPLRPSSPDASHHAVTDQVPLELGNRGENVE